MALSLMMMVFDVSVCGNIAPKLMDRFRSGFFCFTAEVIKKNLNAQ